MKTFKKVLSIVACLSCFTFMTMFTGCTKQMARSIATWENDINQEFEVQGYKSRLYNYQWFYDQYNQCVATANNVKIMTGTDKEGTLMVLNSMIAEYNSKSSQTIDAALWKAKDLPYRLALEDLGLTATGDAR